MREERRFMRGANPIETARKDLSEQHPTNRLIPSELHQSSPSRPQQYLEHLQSRLQVLAELMHQHPELMQKQPLISLSLSPSVSSFIFHASDISLNCL
jgi:hypothetical protein